MGQSVATPVDEKEGLLSDEKPPDPKPQKSKGNTLTHYVHPKDSSGANKNFAEIKFREFQAGANPLCMVLSVR